MPAPISPELAAHMEGDVLSLALCIKISRPDGVVLGFTTLDRPLAIGGVTYEPETGFTPSAVSLETGTKAGGVEAMVFLRSQAVTALQLLSGIYRGSWVDVVLVNWQDVSQGVRNLVSGVLGEVSLDGPAARVEATAMVKLSQTPICRVSSPVCDAVLGDARCKVALGPLTFSGAVSTVTSRRVLRASSLIGRTERFAFGRAKMLTGLAAGEERTIKAFTSATGQVELQEAFRGAVAVGDTLQIIAGCDGLLATCKHYSNVANFRGLPYVPGVDAVVKAPE